MNPVDDERMDEFERELNEAFARRPAPPSLKRRLIERRAAEARRQSKSEHAWLVSKQLAWQQLAAALLLAALVTGGVEWRIALERRREEAARQQVLTALRITSHALDRMNARLTARRHQPQD